jgi:hypothetical protein
MRRLYDPTMRTRSLWLLGSFLLLSACASAPRQPDQPVVAHPVVAPPHPVIACRECGRIQRVEMVSNVRPTASGGAVLGGVVGGVLAGTQSKPAAPARPGVQVLTFRIALQMDDGRRFNAYQSDLAPGLRAGSRIRFLNGRVIPPR